MVCDRWCVTKWCVKEGVSKMVPCLPRKTKVDVTKCHACHVKRRWMSPSVTPATQSAAASPATKTAPSAPPEPDQCHKCHAKRRWMSRNEGACRQGLRLPRKVPRRHRRPKPPQARHQSQPSAVSATPATQSAGGRHQVPRLPRETKVHVAKCHACATPATQNTAHVKDGV